ncbi:Kinesin-like protein [Wickerhamomyces ciferrii]|uniref:Kinesin-like protein n=1 Tax=Wickerhamomyces ciferrii (strain ATCC 14091 / BCRC 22168 / CBS 111 / JCM 3599 / NBRC 0793 / NRRL Y-1031 F-60-10) TaxID=1206466 RepID=K0KN84_WICCF|nr:Kinesin-like protein [Wickerhamomyces ciferrii]CCH42814.1 Kinesin-like protein [Wickerhamomyces ciferrii]
MSEETKENEKVLGSPEIVVSKRTSLGEVSNNRLSMPGKRVSSIPKPSNIPRPNTTPSKETSYITQDGFRSPISPSRSKQNTPPSGLRRLSDSGVPTLERGKNLIKPTSLNFGQAGKNLINPYSKKELENLKNQIDIKEKEFSDLTNKLMSLKTSKQQIEVDNETLEDKLSTLNKTLRIKNNEFENLTLKKQEVAQDMKRSYELKSKQEKVDNEESIYEIEKQYKMEVDRILKSKVSQIQNDKNQAYEKISNLNKSIQNNELNFQNDLTTLRKQYDDEKLKLKEFMEETKKSLEKDCKELDQRHNQLKDEIESIETQFELENKLLEESNNEYEESLKTTSKAEIKFQNLQDQINSLQQSFLDKNTQIKNLKKDTEWKIQQKTKFDEQLIKEEVIRRKLHDKMQELKGNIRVFCRIRPPIKSEIDDVVEIQVPDNDEEEQEISIKDSKPTSSSNNGFNNTPMIPKKYNFKFDRIFTMDSNNQEIFEEISQLIQSALDGFNVCIFAYGQTGSGKTFTMSNENDGMIPLAVDQIFNTSKNLKNYGWDFKFFGEFLEIYNENINDLLGNPNNIDKSKLEIRHDTQNQKTIVTDLTSIELKTPEMVKEVLNKALKNRSIASTKANERSSRSHSVFTINIKGFNKETNEHIEGKLNLIDLAGSERLSHSQASGDRLKETQAINKSLSCLGDVIYALGQESAKHIPFRNSKLTYLLQYSLIGNSKTLMFVNISPFNKFFNETLNSLRFATKVNSTKLGILKKNSSS